MIQYLINNKEWLFGGIGVTALTLLVYFFAWQFRRRKQESSSQRQRSGDDSVNIQVQGNISIDQIRASSDGKADTEGR